MNEERRMILEMLQSGAISVDEAQRLLEAVEPAVQPALASAGGELAVCSQPETFKIMPKRISILVTEGGKPKVNVKIPFSLVRVGLKLGKTFGALSAKAVKDDEQAVKALELLNEIDVDELLDSISDGEITLPYTMVDVCDEEKGELVQIILQ